ncbi:hypothetical protein BGZ99_001273 [Dissophora globulifera]|uniref:Uncharacterized protein n=1 Tax=Dissophora globulifera TaxID=979702 RepID=A0A9P6UKI9_9FUNG|nr:hypothetical protein BGZ99_001273 [Dissophora globulifera]
MVTTRSRGNKQAAAAVAPQQLKRKRSPISTASPASKQAKTDVISNPDLDVEISRELAPTPVSQSQLQPTAPPKVLIDSHGTDSTSTASVIATPVTTTTAPETLAPTAIPAPALTTPSALEMLKEPTPKSEPLPEVATVLSQPTPTVNVVTPSTASAVSVVNAPTMTPPPLPPAPTAPQISTVPALAPAQIAATVAPLASALGLALTPAPASKTTSEGVNGSSDVGKAALTPPTSRLPPHPNDSSLSGNMSSTLRGIDATVASANGPHQPTAPPAPVGMDMTQESATKHHTEDMQPANIYGDEYSREKRHVAF